MPFRTTDIPHGGRVRRMCIVVLLVAAVLGAGCAGGSGPRSPDQSAHFPQFRYSLGVESPVDRRDFSRLELLAPELRNLFDPSRDAYGYDSAFNPFVIESLSGVPFQWSEPVENTLLGMLLDELRREDIFSWVEPSPTRERPSFYLLVNLLLFHYERGDRVFYPQVGLEALLLDGRTRQVVYKTRSMVTDEYGILDETGTVSQHTYMVEDWLAVEFSERSRLALEKAVEKLSERLLDHFYRRVEQEDAG